MTMRTMAATSKRPPTTGRIHSGFLDSLVGTFHPSGYIGSSCVVSLIAIGSLGTDACDDTAIYFLFDDVPTRRKTIGSCNGIMANIDDAGVVLGGIEKQSFLSRLGSKGTQVIVSSVVF
jgi:hypothetical protein